MTTKTLKPCYLVAVRCSVHGGLEYRRSDEQTEQIGENGERSEWATVRTLSDKDEYANATSLRSKLKRDVEKLGVPSLIGTIVSLERDDAIDERRDYWRKAVAEFNAGARYSQVVFNLVRFKIEGENEVLLKSMLDDLNVTLGELREVIESADYEGIRKVLARMKGYTTILPTEVAGTLQNALDDAKVQARQMRRALVKRAEQIEDVQETIASTATVDLARFALVNVETSYTLDDDTAQDDSDDEAIALDAAAGGMRAAAAFLDSDDAGDLGSEDDEDEGQDDDGEGDFAPFASPL